MDSQFRLVTERRFGPFFLTQFFGAFNDNVYKNALIILIAFRLAGGEGSNVLINVAAGLFILPFFLFSATAGQIADKYEKSRIIRAVKLFEILIMCGGAAALIAGSVPALLAVLFLMGAQSSLFGPVKYAILPQHLEEAELVGGNGMVEMGTFVAILLGTMTGGILIGIPDAGPYWVGGAVIVFAVVGYVCSRWVPLAPSADPKLKINWNAATETWRNLSLLKGDRVIFLACLGISWFWFFGATYMTQLPNFTKLTLGGNEQVVTLLLTAFSVGVGVGSLSCEKLSGGRIEIGLVPLGSIGMTVFAIDTFLLAGGFPTDELVGAGAFLAQPGAWRVIADVVLLGAFGGLYIVPLFALVQSRAEPARRSRVIAGLNILNALFMVASAVTAIALLGSGLSIPQLFLVCALMNAAVAVFIYGLVPEFLVRFVVWVAMHTVYRLNKSGLHNVPEQGPALLVCNHVSFVDALVLGGCMPRPPRFVMYHTIFKVPVLSWFFRTVKAIPIAPAKEDPELMNAAMDEIAAELEAGHLVCIFPEGGITKDGEIGEFKSGVERIVARTPVPVVPLALRGLWGSFFSRAHGPAMRHWPRRFWSRIELVAGAPVAPDRVDAADLRAQVVALRGDWQ